MRRSTIPLVITLAATVGLTACNEKPKSVTDVDPASIEAAQDVKVDKEFGDKVRAYILQHPEILIEAQQALQLKAMAEQTANVEKQFAAHKVQLQRDKRDFVINPNGKVTVVQFFDYNCTYCKVIAPTSPSWPGRTRTCASSSRTTPWATSARRRSTRRRRRGP